MGELGLEYADPMPLTHFAFIFKGPGYDPKIHRAALDSAQFHTVVVGVSNLTEAAQVAVELRETGSQLIELCGGFSAADADQIQTRLGPDILVGVVRYSEEQERKLTEMFSL
jgi:phosphoribosylformylglycinamidine (FGAM) synthase-like amidotransferase family enzyme